MGTAQRPILEKVRACDGIDTVHVPSCGTNDSLPALLTGDVDAMFDTRPPTLPQIRAGRVGAIAVTPPARVPRLPDVPTLGEVGCPEVDTVTWYIATWYAVIVPAGTPEPIKARLAREHVAVSAPEETRAFLDIHGLICLPNAPAEFAVRLAAEQARRGRLIAEGAAAIA